MLAWGTRVFGAIPASLRLHRTEHTQNGLAAGGIINGAGVCVCVWGPCIQSERLVTKWAVTYLPNRYIGGSHVQTQTHAECDWKIGLQPRPVVGTVAI